MHFCLGQRLHEMSLKSPIGVSELLPIVSIAFIIINQWSLICSFQFVLIAYFLYMEFF